MSSAEPAIAAPPVPAEHAPTSHALPVSHGWKPFAALSISALGVVYGDIGTSPLYAFRECFAGAHAAPASVENILGVLSLIFWALVFVVSFKYVMLVMRADNRGEGGILALMALVGTRRDESDRKHYILVLLGLFGAALLYGDGMITPAISVLSAVEGLEVATTSLHAFIVPMTVLILVGLFLVQPAGTGKVGTVFGPVMVLWFVAIGGMGLVSIIHKPEVLAALNPMHAVHFFGHNGAHGFLVLGSVFLAVTGGEALYADMGHFGRKPIRLMWYAVAQPALVLNYFGQGALVLRDPSAVTDPFYKLAPSWGLIPLVGLATFATVIASQALISASFSLTRQAVQLGYSPRVAIVHTSSREIGQIYVPGVNWLLMVACIGLVLGFKSSSNLAAAYGLAVTGTMGITTILFFVIARERWGWGLAKGILIAGPLLLVDLSFLGANLLKVADGGWFPLVIGAAAFSLMTTWKRGRKILGERQREASLPLDIFLKDDGLKTIMRVPGLAVFMAGNPDAVPHALLHNLKHNKVLHQRNALLTVVTEEVPNVPDSDRVRIEMLAPGFWRIIARYGFMQDPNIPKLLDLLRAQKFETKIMDTTFFLGRETIIASDRPGMAIWREKLFGVMALNARSATSYFGIPANRVVEMGAQVEI